MNHYLVIGGGCAGTAAIRAIRRLYKGRDDEVFITATTKSRHDVEGANAVQVLKLTKKNVLTDDWLEPLLCNWPYQATFITPAHGRVGIPIDQATEADKQEAFNYSVRPLLRLEARGGFGTLFAFSSFYWLSFMQRFYGAVGHSKRELEAWFRLNPLHRQLIRFGTIESPSLRRIALAAELLVKSKKLVLNNPAQVFPLVPNAGQKTLPQAMFEQMQAEERHFYKVERNTTPQDVENAIYSWLVNPVHKVVNVMGDLQWLGEERIPFDRVLPECVALHRRFCDNLWTMPTEAIPAVQYN